MHPEREISLLRYFGYLKSSAYVDGKFSDRERAELAQRMIQEADPLALKQSKYHGRCGAVAALRTLKLYRPAETFRIEMALSGPDGEVRLLDGQTLKRPKKFRWSPGDSYFLNER